MQALLQDLRYALRQLLRSLGFTLTAILSLALGIGATAAVFSVIYAVLMDPFPYPHSDQISCASPAEPATARAIIST